MPGRFPYLDQHRLLALAHRGGANGAHPENSLEAFQTAVDLGFQYVETDVHASADGHLYAFHDPNLDRVAGIRASIRDLTSAELDRVRFGNGYRIPRFDEILSTWPLLNLNIDPKADAAVQPLVAAIDRHGAIDRVCVGSFSDRRIAFCRDELGPALCTSMGPREVLRLVAASKGLPVGPFASACAQVPLRRSIAVGRTLEFASPSFVDTAHAHGLDVHFWTIDDPATINQLVDLDVDGIMTDCPDVLRSVLIERGRWETTYV